METQWTRMTADEAAEIIQHNDMVAFSGFTQSGSPKRLTHRDSPAELTNSMRPKSRIKFAC